MTQCVFYSQDPNGAYTSNYKFRCRTKPQKGSASLVRLKPKYAVATPGAKAVWEAHVPKQYFSDPNARICDVHFSRKSSGEAEYVFGPINSPSSEARLALEMAREQAAHDQTRLLYDISQQRVTSLLRFSEQLQQKCRQLETELANVPQAPHRPSIAYFDALHASDPARADIECRVLFGNFTWPRLSALFDVLFGGLTIQSWRPLPKKWTPREQWLMAVHHLSVGATHTECAAWWGVPQQSFSVSVPSLLWVFV